MSILDRFRSVRHAAAQPPREIVATPSPTALTTDEETLRREILSLDSGIGIFRWVHLMDALSRMPNAKTVVSVGSGGGVHEALLARIRPDLLVVGVDLRTPLVRADLPNLRFLRGDLLDPVFRASLPQADFVFSIECLEHIEDDRSVARAMAEALLPGGALYLQVPFASRAEQSDPTFCEHERRNHGHVRPGYDAESLRALVESLDLEVDHVASAFWLPLQPMVHVALERLGSLMSDNWRDVFALVSTDVRTGVAPDRTRAIAIKILARKRPR